MNTPAHLIVGAAAFADPGQRRITAAALAGALAPDLSLYVLAGAALYVFQIPPRVVFDELYFSAAWQRVFAIDNSFFVWGLLFLLAWRLKSAAFKAFAGAGLLHLALDFPFHYDDARPHFWPLTDWAFASPVSYWDPARHGGIVGPLEVLLCVVLTVFLFGRFQSRRARTGFGVLLGAEVMAAGVFWSFIF